MGLFDFFKKDKPSYISSDWVWKAQSDKEMGLLEHLQQFPNVRLLAWSARTQAHFEDFLNRKGAAKPVDLAGTLMPSRLEGLHLIFLEHHLSLEKEKAFLDQAQPKSVLFLNALDDPIFKSLGMSERITNLMDRMGMKPGERIEHNMINKSIQRAQLKFKEKSTSDLPQDVKDWLDTVRD